MSMTKTQIAIIGAIAVAGLVTLLVAQHQTIQELRRENEGLKQQAEQVAPLQEQLARAAQEATNAESASTAQTPVRELARLRNEVSQLRRQTNELAKARQEIQMLNQRAASETEARRSAAAALQAENQKTQSLNACINNLRLIDAAKQQWALEQRKQATDTPVASDLQPYLGRGPSGEMPTCPDGGTYTFGTVGEKPICTVPGHVLP
jgi:chromosome segregation ATPase